MGRSRVLSFIRSRTGNSSKNDGSSSSSPNQKSSVSQAAASMLAFQKNGTDSPPPEHVPSPANASPAHTLRKKGKTRPDSVFLPQAPLVDLTLDTLPELEPIFTHLSSHANKLYQEGYFLKLNDLDTQGRPAADRQWVECFAQLIGTVLSLWEASALDAAGAPGDVSPTFINLADASIKMIETLPTRNEGSQPLQNVLSVSTAGKNRYLFHFNSLHSLTTWTAGIRLSILENTLLQESYTGALIAGKGKSLNNIGAILERSKFKYEDWVRVRFGPGTPWKRCWCVITPPDEKQLQKMQKAQKKKSAYDRVTPTLKGDVKFYETKKTKKVQPIATITDAYSAYALYPQSRPLIDQSTLVKVEGQITVHSDPQTSSEGFVFVLPEIHPAVSGFEMMLRWLIPVYDTFGLYGRPTRLIADTQSTKSLMFALPKRRSAGYLEILDVASLIHANGSQSWDEREWRKQMKDAAYQRMLKNSNSRESSVSRKRGAQRSSLPARAGTSLRFDVTPTASTDRLEYNNSTDAVFSQQQGRGARADGRFAAKSHGRAASETTGLGYGYYRGRATPPSRSSFEKDLVEEEEPAPSPPPHAINLHNGNYGSHLEGDRSSTDSDIKLPHHSPAPEIVQRFQPNPPPAPVAFPPAFSHSPGQMPLSKPQASPELHKAGNRMSHATLSQMVDMNKMNGMAAAGAAAAWSGNKSGQAVDQGQRGVESEIDSGMITSTDRKVPPERSNIVDPSTTPYAVGEPHGSPRSDPNRTPTLAANNSYFYSQDRSPPKLRSLDTRKSISRKPVPQQTFDSSADRSPETISSSGSLINTVDLDALDLIIARNYSPPPPQSAATQDTESVYDQSSVASPDYDSSRKSSVSKKSTKSVYRPRMGVMKVVGAANPTVDDVVIGDARYQHADTMAPESSEIPLVDFGPTHVYSPTTRRPSTSDTLNMLTHNRNPSEITLRQHDKKASLGKISPGAAGDRASPQQDDRRKSMIWHPGMAVSGQPSSGLTPEQFVHQRASASRVTSPVYPHRRSPSGTTPPPRPASGDWTTYVRQQSAGRDTPPRPHSRGASVMLSQSDLSPHLSAREQEHVARVTGSSFFNLTSESSKQPPQLADTGLVHAIDARERERRAMKEGVSGHMVQQAIAQRHAQAQHQYAPSVHYPYTYPNQQPYSSHQHNGSYGYIPQQPQPHSQPHPQQWGGDQQYQLPQPTTPQSRQQQAPTPPGYRPNPYYQPNYNQSYQ
ncbi:hypothetical protein AJ80_04170 [Polytolypa hystricis UAMH7299]|uniref:PH domain-containing protein n=1 Tax=Polytolypa hystricis (strain UAMH7299) TaxID=1447883 RepID=A0A2B7YDN4_POLH7|nr:hypothetical protein AJ80_04170 [Polytolypa hystricis UAMH7299]